MELSIKKRLSENYYIVQSGDRYYEVNPKNLTCGCKNFLHRKKKQWIPCRHVQFIGDIHYQNVIDSI